MSMRLNTRPPGGGRRTRWTRRTWLAATMAAAALPAALRAAPAYPARPVRVVVPWPAGGTADAGARRFASLLERHLGGAFVVENRPGASGQVGTEFVARAAPDGYTLLAGDVAANAINPCVSSTMKLDSSRDLQPVSLRSRAPLVLVVHAGSGIRSLEDLVARSRAGAEPMAYASPGAGGLHHLEMERLARATGARLVPVAYKGESLAVTDVAGGQVPVMFCLPVAAMPHIQSGRLRALMVTSRKRIPLLPQVPTAAEVGRADLEAVSWGAFYAPRNTPREIVDRLAAAIAAAGEDPGLREFLAQFGAEPMHSTPEELAQWTRAESTRLCAMVRELGLRAP